MESHLSATLREVLGKSGLRPADICRSSGMTNSFFSRFFSGRQSFVSNDDLKRITTALPAKHRASIVRARLLDMASELKDIPGSDRIDVRVSIRKP